MKRPQFVLGTGGCGCSACTYTATFAVRGFADWPKGERATPSEARKLYTAHASFAWKDARKGADFGPAGAGFYGVPAGSTRAQVAGVLAQSFAESPPE